MKRGCWNWWNYKTMFEVVHLKYISKATPYFWCTHKNESPIHTPLNLEVNAVERSTSHHVGRYASDVSPVICHSGSRWIKKYAFRHPHTHTHRTGEARPHTAADEPPWIPPIHRKRTWEHLTHPKRNLRTIEPVALRVPWKSKLLTLSPKERYVCIAMKRTSKNKKACIMFLKVCWPSLRKGQ